MIDPMLLVSAYLFPAMILWNAGSFINTLTHMIGYRNHETSDNSTNIPLLGILMWGEGWHNNHHAFPNSARHGLQWWQFDMSWIVIRAMQSFGLAWNVKLPSKRHLASKRLVQSSS